MSSDETYNGWTNYATWRINLEVCDDLTSSLIGEQTFDDVSALAEYLRDTTEELVCGDDYHQQNLATQYAMAFIDQVNWYEIAATNEELIAADDDDESLDQH
jgi:hypothetical protein